MNTYRAKSLTYSMAFVALFFLTAAQICSAQPSAVAPAKPGDTTSVSPISSTQKQIALNTINYYRAIGHLGPIAWNDKISQAAYKHSRYRVVNASIRESPHDETSGLPEFTAVNFWDRATLAGYQGDTYAEGLRREVDPNVDPASVVKALLAGPYHRQPFLTAGAVCVGIGEYQLMWTFDFGGKPADVSVWPASGITRVPRSGVAKDTPDPMRIHGVPGDDVGYVVTVQYKTPGFKFREATMTDAAGVPVKLYINNAQNDVFCQNCVIMIPVAKLAAHTIYKCHVAMITGDGAPLIKDWSFTTGDDDDNFDLPQGAPKTPNLDSQLSSDDHP